MAVERYCMQEYIPVEVSKGMGMYLCTFCICICNSFMQYLLDVVTHIIMHSFSKVGWNKWMSLNEA